MQVLEYARPMIIKAPVTAPPALPFHPIPESNTPQYARALFLPITDSRKMSRELMGKGQSLQRKAQL